MVYKSWLGILHYWAHNVLHPGGHRQLNCKNHCYPSTNDSHWTRRTYYWGLWNGHPSHASPTWVTLRFKIMYISHIHIVIPTTNDIEPPLLRVHLCFVKDMVYEGWLTPLLPLFVLHVVGHCKLNCKYLRHLPTNNPTLNMVTYYLRLQCASSSEAWIIHEIIIDTSIFLPFFFPVPSRTWVRHVCLTNILEYKTLGSRTIIIITLFRFITVFSGTNNIP